MKKHNLIILSLLLFSYPIFAYQPTAGELHQNPALCSYGYNSNCNSGGGTSVNRVYLPDKYGAIAMNDTGFATASNAISKRKAEKEALSKCKRGGQVGCKVYLTVRNGCFSGALGHYKNGLVKPFFYSTANKGEAENAVLKKCYSYNEYKFEKCTIFIPEECSLPTLP